MALVAPLVLLALLALVDLALLASGRMRERLGRARWSLLAAPLGALGVLAAGGAAFGEPPDERVRLGLLVSLPVFSFLAGLCFLATLFVGGRPAARPLLALHLAAAVLLGVLSMLALEQEDPLRLSTHGAAPGASLSAA